jgi:hypothetical protein
MAVRSPLSLDRYPHISPSAHATNSIVTFLSTIIRQPFAPYKIKRFPQHRTTSPFYPATYNLSAGKRLADCDRPHAPQLKPRRNIMLWTIIVVLFILWLLGFSLHVGGGLIHILLVLAVIVLIFNLLSGRRGI